MVFFWSVLYLSICKFDEYLCLYFEFIAAYHTHTCTIYTICITFQSASNVASSKSKDAKTKKDNIKYAAWAAEQITKQYKVRAICPKCVNLNKLSTIW